MFEATLQLRVSRNEFFELLVDSIQGEYEHYTGKKLERNKVRSGLTYKKPVQYNRKKIDGVVKVERLVKDELYQSRIKSSAATNTIRYILSDAEQDDEIVITYQQETIMANGKKPKNNGFFHRWQEKRRRRQTVALLRQMEDHIIANRDKEVE